MVARVESGTGPPDAYNTKHGHTTNGDELLRFDGFEALVEFGHLLPGYGGLTAAGTRDQNGRALAGEIEPGHFFVAGFKARVTFRARGRTPDGVEFLREGVGEYQADRWIPHRRVNGDQALFGLRLAAGGSMFRVLSCRWALLFDGPQPARAIRLDTQTRAHDAFNLVYRAVSRMAGVVGGWSRVQRSVDRRKGRPYEKGCTPRP